MRNIWKRIEQNEQAGKLLILLLFTFFSLALVSFRIYYTHTSTFKFLVWNLFLAWIPFGVSLIMILYQDKIKSWWIIAGCLSVWLAFFPNAPYIFTDLFHLRKRADVTLWYDTVLILSFAWTGLLLGILSLYDIQTYITQRVNVLAGWIFATCSLVLAGFGVYLGRFLRWNTWDILTHPWAVIRDVISPIIHPLSHKQPIAITLLFSCFLILLYLSFQILLYAPKKINTQEKG
jgi:uncharacterized membrane protein